MPSLDAKSANQKRVNHQYTLYDVNEFVDVIIVGQRFGANFIQA